MLPLSTVHACLFTTARTGLWKTADDVAAAAACSVWPVLQEVEVLQQCDDLLKKLGMKGSIFGSTVPGQAREPVQSDDSSSSSSAN
jgi:hypothetical protein